MSREIQEIKKLFDELRKQDKQPFPKKGGILNAPREHGVYIIRRNVRGKETVEELFVVRMGSIRDSKTILGVHLLSRNNI